MRNGPPPSPIQIRGSMWMNLRGMEDVVVVVIHEAVEEVDEAMALE